MRSALLVAVGGALGALSRWGVGLAAARWTTASGLPIGTWAVNATGCFLIGLALPWVVDDRLRLAAVVGFLGAFTTFSTYSADTIALWEQGRAGWALANAFGSVAVGLAAVALGLAAARAV